MKSINNNTEYDDKLFYQTITASLQKLLILPVHNLPAEVEDTHVKISHEKSFPVYATAPGTVYIKDKTIIIKHENCINTIYTNVIPDQNLKSDTKIKQNEVIGQAVKQCEITIQITPAFMIQDPK